MNNTVFSPLRGPLCEFMNSYSPSRIPTGRVAELGKRSTDPDPEICFLRTMFSQLKWCENPEIFRRTMFSQLKWCENPGLFLRSQMHALTPISRSRQVLPPGATGGRGGSLLFIPPSIPIFTNQGSHRSFKRGDPKRREISDLSCRTIGSHRSQERGDPKHNQYKPLCQRASLV
jgi:hypothetical protein